MAVTLEAGDRAPAFKLRDQDGKQHTLEDYRGQKVVLYFYPKDETPGCTTQACSLRDHWEEIRAEGATVLGVIPSPIEGGEGNKEFLIALKRT